MEIPDNRLRTPHPGPGLNPVVRRPQKVASTPPVAIPRITAPVPTSSFPIRAENSLLAPRGIPDILRPYAGQLLPHESYFQN